VKKAVFTRTLFNTRSILLVGVLLTLCTSEGVGLQLLPFPSKSGRDPAEYAQTRSAVDCKRTPSHSQNIPSRVEIAAPKPKKFSPQQKVEKLVTAALIATWSVEAISLQETHSQQPQSGYSFAFSSQPATRAPPRLA
jgi:hypothetical protein